MLNLLEDLYRNLAGLPKVERFDKDINFKDLIERGATILDVRRVEEYKMGHIENAINIPVEELQARIHELEATKTPILAYCRSGRRSGKAKKMLNKAGYTTHNAGGYQYLIEKL